MKLLSLLTAGLLLMAPTILTAEDIDVRRHIEVQGKAQVLADVDRAIWHFKVRAEAPALADASASLEKSIASLQERLKGVKIPQDSFRLSGISSGRVYENTRESRIFKGYFAQRQAVIEIPDLGLRESLERALLADDQIEIEQVELKSTKHEDLRKRSLIAAVAAAKAKAAFLAEEAGAVLGVVLSIQEGVNNPGYGILSNNRIEMPVFDLPAAAEFEKLEYSATVTVKFELR